MIGDYLVLGLAAGALLAGFFIALAFTALVVYALAVLGAVLVDRFKS